MYSRKAWGGSVDPFILVKFSKSEVGESDPLASLVIFEWQDYGLIGKSSGGDGENERRETICDQAAVNAKSCTQEQLGSFLLASNATDVSKNPIISQAIHLKDPDAVKYPVKNTGFYCVSTYAYSGEDYTAVVTFRNSFGELPATQIAKLPFYGTLSLVADILPVQNYITAIFVFLVVEEVMTWGFYNFQNIHGLNAGAKAFMILVAILNAGRNAFSFFLLLIVCMGYGVVKPSLGRTMIYVRILAIGHFVFAVVYSIASLSITPDSAGPLVLLIVLPLAGTLTAFYVWTLNSLNATMKDLIDRKQKTKAMMYKKLWWCILGSIIVIFGFFFINSFAMAGSSDASFVPEHWKSRWFVLDGWLNIVYLFDIAFVAYLWRPTANNRRFAMSDELAQDDDGFEIRSFGSGLDEEDPFDALPEYPGSSAAEGRRDLSPLPPKPVSGGPARQSLEEETIFAVGDEDKWSDDEGTPRNSGERQRLTEH
ncbi:Transmembrane receptor eukaryota [Penicillium chermesinum]|nr:Transmembrane receptor eukaryota [Penicillium chermesinum]